MNRIVNQSIKLMLVAIIVCLSAYFFLRVKIEFVLIMFLWLLSSLEIPYWIRNDDVSIKTRIILLLFFGILNIAIISNIYGIGKNLQLYILGFFILVIASIVSNFIRKKFIIKKEQEGNSNKKSIF